MAIHELKTRPEHYQAVVAGLKKAEVRLNDRGYQAGDMLRLREFDPKAQEYTGEDATRRVCHVADLAPWMSGYVLLSLACECVPDGLTGRNCETCGKAEPVNSENWQVSHGEDETVIFCPNCKTTGE